MKKVNVIIKDKSTLVLLENANKDDIIDLNAIQTLDTSFLDELISKEKEALYQQRINEKLAIEKELLNKNNQLKIDALHNKYTNEINELKLCIESNEAIKANEIALLNAKHKNTINTLEAKLNEIINLKKLEIDNIVNDINNKHNIEIANLKSEINNIKKDSEILLAKQAEINTLEKSNLREKYEKENKEIQTELEKLRLQKSNLNVKMLGEELERWCNEEYEAYAAFGFNHCTWNKDNQSIKENDEIKGSKADYIFKCYLDDKHSILLSSVCCEMKNEGLDTKNKKKNSDHFAKLDKDRNKKNCEYALLISELEWDSPNDAPIKKIRDYDKMYMVRPQYFITFLSLIASLANKYSDIITSKQEKEIKLLSSIELIDEFNSLKNTYFEKPLGQLISKIEDIRKQSSAISKANQAINDTCNEILNTTISTIKDKIERFNIKKLSNSLKNINNE